MSEENTISKDNNSTIVFRGLEDVVAAETDISFVDGENSQIYYKGYNIHDISEHTVSYAEIVYLLLNGELPTSFAISALTEGRFNHAYKPGNNRRGRRKHSGRGMPFRSGNL